MVGIRIKIRKAKKESKLLNAPKKEDRRKHHRVDFIRRATYKMSNYTSQTVFTQNLSVGGMCLLLDNEVLPGMILELKFESPIDPNRLTETYAQVAWQDNFLTGVKFIN